MRLEICKSTNIESPCNTINFVIMYRKHKKNEGQPDPASDDRPGSGDSRGWRRQLQRATHSPTCTHSETRPDRIPSCHQ